MMQPLISVYSYTVLLVGLLLFQVQTISVASASTTAAATEANVPEEEVEVDMNSLPAMLDAEDIAYFFAQGDMDRLHNILATAFTRSSRNPITEQVIHDLPEVIVARGGGQAYTTAYKLDHDIEQATYLADTLTDVQQADFFRNVVVPTYQSFRKSIPPLQQLEQRGTGGLVAIPTLPNTEEPQLDTFRTLYNKALHQVPADQQSPSTQLLNPNLKVEQIQKEWSQSGILAVDDLLTPDALAAIQRIMWESTVFYQTKLPKTFGGYVGAYIDDGLHDKILLQLAWALAQKFPKIFEKHDLRYLWAYKYSSEYTGINLHADQAAINVNIWLTPDEANLDPTSGGLVVFTAKPPADWSFDEYNKHTDQVRELLLRPTNFANVTIPYKTNRAVIFDSALFHQTDEFSFRPGYKNRRINLTLLFGEMQRPVAVPSDATLQQEL